VTLESRRVERHKGDGRTFYVTPVLHPFPLSLQLIRAPRRRISPEVAGLFADLTTARERKPPRETTRGTSLPGHFRLLLKAWRLAEAMQEALAGTSA